MRNLLQTGILTVATVFGLSAQTDRVPSGTQITVRTNETINARSPSDSRIYTAVVDRDVRDSSNRVIIPRGSRAELILRDVGNSQVALDLESIDVRGRRYIVSAQDETVATTGSRREGVGANTRTGRFVGGGALAGTIIGAIAGGGTGAAIGAAAGAGAGAIGQTATRGGSVRVPAETLLTFRLDRPLIVGADSGFNRDGFHYHGNDSSRSRTP